MQVAHDLLDREARLAGGALEQRREWIVLGRKHLQSACRARERLWNALLAISHLLRRRCQVDGDALTLSAHVRGLLRLVLDVASRAVHDQRRVQRLEQPALTAARTVEI